MPMSSILHPSLPFLAAGDRETAPSPRICSPSRKQWSVAGYTGTCLRTLGLVTGGDEGTEHLRCSVELLERSPRRLELAHALVELGAALRRAKAREPLRNGIELAHRCGALPLVERAHAELHATGTRPRKLVSTGIDSLIAQERRVAEMAAEGLSNPEIAQTLFVTRRTVETHLRHAYQKLDIGRREELKQALEPAVA
jgi:DNA-binding CsgD family transcriptional regulator